MSDVAADTSSEITTEDFEEAVVEEAENGRGAPARGNASEENGEQEADSKVDEEAEEGGGREGEEADAATCRRAAEVEDDDDVDTKKRKTDEDGTAQKEKLSLKGHRDLVTLHFPSQNLHVVPFEEGPACPPAHCGQRHPQVTRRPRHPARTTTRTCNRGGKKNHNFQGPAFFS
ncbi:hypothetical protein EI555_012759 [Monodon monoceros]|uniref:Prothymosin alpha n=1 Tax=Monodon monoceros TaxID=40151 RepID=A0A4U1F128_MONMO|nr:hypothetical protein EI555_012759 [Monodon monoceros]